MIKLTAATTTLAALAIAAAPAHADSIAYVKGGDLWLSTSDGARQYQVTATGGYSSVSQDDLGNLVALHGDRIRTLSPAGAVKHDILTPASSSMPGTQFRGPFDPVVSPNGVKIAYSWYYTETSSSPSCNPSTGCQTVYGRQGTGYTRPDRITGFDEDGFNSQSGWVGPSWTTSGGTILSDPVQVGNEQVVVHTPGIGDGAAGGMNRWFNDNAANGLRDVEMSPDKQKLAGVSGDQNEAIRFYRAKGGHPTIPDACYALTGDVGRYQQPSWSPDSTRLAFADDTGVRVIAIPDMTQDCGTPTDGGSLLIPGAKHPDWGPADVPPARAAADPAPKLGPDPKSSVGTGIQGGPGTDPQPATVTFRTAKATRAALRRGLTVTVRTPQPGRVTAKLSFKGKPIATGRARAKGAGTVKVTLSKLTSRRAAKLRGRKVRLTVTVGGARVARTLKVR